MSGWRFSFIFLLICCKGILTKGHEEEERLRTTLLHWFSQEPESSSNSDIIDSGRDYLDTTDDDSQLKRLARSEAKGSHNLRQNSGEEIYVGNKSLTLWNCSRIYSTSTGYNASRCQFVKENCEAKAHLMNYLAFMMCDLPSSAVVSSV